MNYSRSRERAQTIRGLAIDNNAIAAILEAESTNCYCHELIYFEAIEIICNNFQSTPLLTAGKVFINLARKYAEENRTDKALEILDGLAFILRQQETNNGAFDDTDLEIMHYECLLDKEYARLGELRFARERVTSRIQELKSRRSEEHAETASEKCFQTLDAIDAMQDDATPVWTRLKPMLRELELSNERILKPFSRGKCNSNKTNAGLLKRWQPIMVVLVMVLCSFVRVQIIETVSKIAMAKSLHTANAHTRFATIAASEDE